MHQLNVEEIFTIKNKVILITGATSGIGRETAILFNSLGAKIILIGRDETKMKNVEKELHYKQNYLSFLINLTYMNALEEIIERSVNKFGPINGFIHSAGIEMTKPISIMKSEDYMKLFKVNIISGFELVKIISRKKYLPENGASYVFISSIMGSLGDVGKVGYSASKSALSGGTKSLALELAPKKIRVNTIMPGIVKTPMTEQLFSKLPKENIAEIIKNHPLGIGNTSDIAYACIYLISNASIWITGTNLIIDGGYSAK